MLKPQSEIQPHGTPHVIQKPSNLQHPATLWGSRIIAFEEANLAHPPDSCQVLRTWCRNKEHLMSMLAILLGKARTRRPFKQEIMAAPEASSLNPCIRSNFAHPPSSDEPCSKCLTSWHQIRKCLRHCLRLAYARTGFAYAHILSYAELTLAYAHHCFAYAAALQGAPCLTITQGFKTWLRCLPQSGQQDAETYRAWCQWWSYCLGK